MSKYHERKGSTVAIPSRVMNKVALSMIPMKRVDSKGFLGYEGSVKLAEGEITIRANSIITPQDTQMFYFVLSQWQAMRKTTTTTEQSDVLYVDIPKVLNALGIANRTENRQKVISHLERMMGVTITFKFMAGSLAFNALEFVKIENANTVSIRVSRTFEEAVLQARQRFINVDKGMKLRSGYAIELRYLLQIDGAGVDRSGLPIHVNSISHQRVCAYLLLEDGTRETLEEVRRAFRNLEKIGVPKYKNITLSGHTIWQQDGRNLSKKSLKILGT